MHIQQTNTELRVKISIAIVAVAIIALLAGLIGLLLLNPAIGRELVVASTYGDAKDIKRTGETLVATGAPLDANGMTVAHRTLPFGTKLTLRRGHWSAVVVVNDRGPFVQGRTLDLTPAVNRQLRCGGLCRVRVEPWPPLPKPRPFIPEPQIAWGEE